MDKETPIINILTYRLPYDLTNQIYNEYQERYREVIFLVDNANKFKNLKENLKTVELLLALSIFHKRVISNLDAAIKFYGTVSKYSQAEVIRIGNYNFTGDEKNKLLGVVMNYHKLIEKFGIPTSFMDYYLTKEFLQKILDLKRNKNNGDSDENKTEEKKDNNDLDIDLENLPF